jgi:hypothetical protein
MLRLAAIAFMFVTCLALAEVAARLAGETPWQPSRLDVRIEPGGSLFEPDPRLGYRHRAGRYEVRQGLLRFALTHDPRGLRATHLERAPTPHRPELWIFGDSITHGWSVNDDETYAWLLQERFPALEVVNFGVSGYGTLHGWLQFEDELAAGRRAAVAVVAYASFHDDRNTFARERRKLLVPWNRLGPLAQPRARLEGAGELRIERAEARYAELPLMRRLAVAHLVERAWNRLEQRRLRGADVSLAILERFAERARGEGLTLVVAGLTRDAPTQVLFERCRARGIRTVDVAVDLELPGMSNLPWDPHPSARAHQLYAERLGGYLEREGLAGAASSPR